MDLYVGISGGHSRSQGIALQGTEVVASVVGESLNYHTLGLDALTERTSHLLEMLAHDAGYQCMEDIVQNTRRITFSLPAVTDERVAHSLRHFHFRTNDCLTVVDDTWAGMIGGTLDRKGICAIAGTGASVFVGLDEFPFPRGKQRKLDGFGPVLGDWGSGYRLACCLLEQYGRHYDRFATPALIPLFEEILDAEPAIGDVDGVQKWFDDLRKDHPQDWPARFAQLAAVVTTAAERDPPVRFAVDLVKQSARDFARTIQIGLTRAELELRKRQSSEFTIDDLRVVCTGGQFWHSQTYFDEVRKVVGETHPKTDVFLAKFTPVVGAALMAFAEDRYLPSPDDVIRIANNVLAHQPAHEQGFVIPRAPIPAMLQPHASC